MKTETEMVKKQPVPAGFPLRRTEPPPPLDEKQARFVDGYSLFFGFYLYCLRLDRSLNCQSPRLYFSLGAVCSTLTGLLVLVLFPLVLLDKPERQPFINGMGVPHVTSYIWAGFLILLSLLVLSYIILNGKRWRKERWEEYAWPSFAQFSRWEAWMAYIGFTEFIAVLGTFLLIISALLKGFI
jgi:hypothetical protein